MKSKAAILQNYGEKLVLDEIDVADPQDGEVRVKMRASGVCHSDMHVIKGDLPIPTPCVLGHEGSATIEAVGKGVSGLKEGDDVILSWVPPCGNCHYCISGKAYLCESSQMAMLTGGSRLSRGGQPLMSIQGVASFAERTTLPASGCIPIHNGTPHDVACLVGCGVMTGVGAAINTVDILAGQSVAVIGCGGVGLNVIQGAAIRGAGQIIAVDRVPAKLEMAKQFGATHVVNSAESGVSAGIQAATGGLGADWAFEVVGVPELITEAFMAVKRGGKAVVVGVPPVTAMVSVPAAMLALAEKSLIGSLYGSGNLRRDMPRMLDLYAAGKLKLKELVSRKLPLEKINDAFDAMMKGEVARSVIVY
ncbi:MAG TPA: Zn-dependent alcohol dehydrogenase [Candidatus Binatia bacterium]|nr:Zn-dependent alcohol dehydrogenase [Candidatus Binatia bacterium]